MESKNRILKSKLVDKCFDITKEKSVVVLNNKCLTANEVNSLRKNARQSNVEVTVFKNKLAVIALRKQNIHEEFLMHMRNQTILLVSNDVIDAIGVTKDLPKKSFDFVGYLENEKYDTNAEAIAALMDYGTFKKACGGFIATLQESLYQISRIFQVISEKHTGENNPIADEPTNPAEEI